MKRVITCFVNLVNYILRSSALYEVNYTGHVKGFLQLSVVCVWKLGDEIFVRRSRRELGASRPCWGCRD